MYKVLSTEDAMELIHDGDVVCVNSFLGIENPVELHEAIYKKYKATGSPKHLTMISSAGFGLWKENGCAEDYIREGAVDKIICGHFGAMFSTKKLVLQNKFEAYNLPLGCISHALRAQAGGLPGALSKVGLDIFVDPRIDGPGINDISKDDSLVKYVEVDGEEFLYYKLPPINVALLKGTAADHKGNITFDDMFMSGDALSICQATKANGGKVIVQVDRIVGTPSRPRNTIIPGSLVDAIVVVEPEPRHASYESLTGSFEIPYSQWQDWSEMLEKRTSTKSAVNIPGNIIGKRAAMELEPEDIVNIGVGIPEMVSKYARESGILEKITLTVESGGVGGFPASGKVFGAVIGADSMYDMANQFDLYNHGGLDVCFMGGIEVDKFGNVNAHRGPGAFAGVGGFANITAKTKKVVFCLTFNTKGLSVEEQGDKVTIKNEGTIGKFVDNVTSISFSAKRALVNNQQVIYVTERCVFELVESGLKLIEVYPGIDMQKEILDLLPFKVEVDASLL
ncbi:MAG: malonate decarboxylase subunit alpha [Lachnospiraceae bacterium]|nr:malonate decarboxylase subunit alpha [Lachnospiraceae bacterium]MCR4801448.1 malonate decarboxylase subunit alpha [Lachnospiraceae bacterium]